MFYTPYERKMVWRRLVRTTTRDHAGKKHGSRECVNTRNDPRTEFLSGIFHVARKNDITQHCSVTLLLIV